MHLVSPHSTLTRVGHLPPSCISTVPSPHLPPRPTFSFCLGFSADLTGSGSPQQLRQSFSRSSGARVLVGIASTLTVADCEISLFTTQLWRGWGERKEEERKRYRFCKRKSAVGSQPQFLEKPVLELWRPRLPPTRPPLRPRGATLG